MVKKPSESFELTEDVELFFYDVMNSVRLAMREARIPDDKIEEVHDTVEDYVTNQYGG